MKALRDFARPIDKKGSRAFLGTARYYWRFIPKFARRAGPLYDALKKGVPNFVGWMGSQIGAFNHLVYVLCDAHTLTLPRDDDNLVLPLMLHCEGSELCSQWTGTDRIYQ